MRRMEKKERVERGGEKKEGEKRKWGKGFWGIVGVFGILFV